MKARERELRGRRYRGALHQMHIMSNDMERRKRYRVVLHQLHIIYTCLMVWKEGRCIPAPNQLHIIHVVLYGKKGVKSCTGPHYTLWFDWQVYFCTAGSIGETP